MAPSVYPAIKGADMIMANLYLMNDTRAE